MNKNLPCYIVSDLLPLYQDDLLSEKTKKDMKEHLKECQECKKKLDAMKIQMPVSLKKTELKTNPLRKVRLYQRMVAALGAVIAFIFGACCPIAVYGFAVLKRGELAVYQIERLQNLWYVVALQCLAAGAFVCIVYFLILWIVRKILSSK